MPEVDSILSLSWESSGHMQYDVVFWVHWPDGVKRKVFQFFSLKISVVRRN